MAPYNFVYPNIQKDILDAQIDTSRNQGFVVMDFDLEYSESDQEMPLNYKLMAAQEFPGFHEFHDQKMLQFRSEDASLADLDRKQLESQVETAKAEFPILWPDVFGGTGINPFKLNSQIRLGEKDFGIAPSDESMVSFKMGLSPILAHQKFSFNHSNKTVLSNLAMSQKQSNRISQNSNFLKKSEKNEETRGEQTNKMKTSNVDPKFIRSKLSGNELKVIRNLPNEEGNKLLIELFHRRMDQIRQNKKKTENEVSQKKQKISDARNKKAEIRKKYDAKIEENKAQMEKRGKEIRSLDCGNWASISSLLELDQYKLKGRFIEAVESKAKVAD